ncbi:hypothetical protein Gasu2_15300 [Galdieria sulphuraria]|uniref:AMP-dependent synthetase/ligase domain-containing protein n=1 Tax=Galdieria sulphuraria TaxID=130081 RepID=M2W8X0_GALSU|nr:uncharacterized protein Gasu_04060 [Galdieria sulphuraria]EME32311.1 hypothetical protein Gasu_04060 [Galdieria sulphuraria]GJD07153.1 hypothetical protein Gasu2_15300 [Galdieria sulphuraria]|eukprot:XP_005708831.1 hypothetical protein Gasu_04060 [Galdieria sulphuraria]
MFVSSCTRNRVIYLFNRGISTQKISSNIIGEVLDRNAKERPHKNALKFLATTKEEAVFFTFAEVQRHVQAFAQGLLELGYGPTKRIACCLPLGSPEFVFACLGSLKSRTTLISLDFDRSSNEIDPSEVCRALEHYKPKGLIMWHGYKSTNNKGNQNSYVGPDLWTQLFPELVDFGKGLEGFTRNNGRPLSLHRFPGLRHIFHSGNANLPGLIQYRNLLVYNNDAVSSNGTFEWLPDEKATLFLSSEDSKEYSGGDILDAIQRCLQAIQYSSNHNTKQGRVVIAPNSKATMSYLAYIIASLQQQTLAIIPSLHYDDTAIEMATKIENAQKAKQ